MEMVIGIKAEHIAEYRQLHAAVWPTVLERLRLSNVHNYAICLREPEKLLFGCWEYHGDDFAADMAAIAAVPKTQRWWRICNPLQLPLASRKPDEHWAAMDLVFHLD